MKNLLPYIIGGITLVVLITFLMLNQHPSTQSTQIGSSGSNTTPQDPQEIVPGLYKNPIQNSSTQKGFDIIKITVENNTDATGKVISDHLELALKNTSGKDLTNLEIYYTITDLTTNKKEGYYKKLAGFTLKNDQTQTIHLDNKTGVGHFSINKNSIYFNSNNKLLFDVIVNTPGYQSQIVQVTKDAGGAEIKD